jgi:hypothetical protein
VEQIHEVIALLQTAEKQATNVIQTMRNQSLLLGPTLDHVEEELAQFVNRLHYMERVAQRLEASETQRAKIDSSSDEA